MISVSEVITDPDMAQTLTVQRNAGAFVLGGYQTTPSTLSMLGVVTVAKDQDLETVPEGDRIAGAMAFYTVQQLFETTVRGGIQGASQISDVVTWRGQQYRIVDTKPYVDYGYFKSVGVRMSGE